MQQYVVTILIPCFDQPHLLERCLFSIERQAFKNFKIVIIDDCSHVSYKDVVDKYPDMNIYIFRQEINLGAIENMIFCLKYPVDTMFKLIFHEDDVMYPRLIEEQVNAFTNKPEIGWVGTNMNFFRSTPSEMTGCKEIRPLFYKNDLRPLVTYILKGNSLSLGSIMYRSAICHDAYFDLEQFSVLGDRHMLLELGKLYGCGYINCDLVAAYDHSEGDNRWNGLRQLHINNYYAYLAGYFDGNKTKEIKAGLTYSIINTFRLLSKEYQYNKFRFFFYAYKKGYFYFKYYLLSISYIRRVAISFKGIYT